MFKIILADDEPIIIKGLRKLVDWSSWTPGSWRKPGTGKSFFKR